MKPVQQTKIGYPDGNCLSACIASVFGVEIDSVPDFGTGSQWYDKFTDYMIGQFGLQPIDIEYPCCFEPKGYHFINGKSPRGNYLHAIVGKDGEGVHDPYPGGDCELVEITSLTIFVKHITDEYTEPKKLWCPVCEWYTEQEWIEHAELWHCKSCGKLVE